MGLRGTLSDVGPLEAIQMIALQSRTGCLTIRAGGEKTSIDFVGGAILSMHSPKLRGKSPLVQLFRELEVLDNDQIHKWLDLNDPYHTDPLDILDNLSFLPSEKLREVYRIYLDAQLGRLLRQRRGRFHFSGAPRGRKIEVLKPISADALLLEGLRRGDEVEDLLNGPLPPEAVPVILELHSVPMSKGEETLEQRMTRIVRTQCDGRWPLSELMERSALPDYEIVTVLARDVESGRLRLVGDPARPFAGPEAGEGWIRRSLAPVLTAAAVLLVVMGIRLALDRLPAPAMAGDMPLSSRGEIETIWRRNETLRQGKLLLSGQWSTFHPNSPAGALTDSLKAPSTPTPS
ncbi:MAG: DUF4388 domain-containing protein [Candidatus Eisenbacteria bacterium]|uniref:DUF4388 domain-containing protein n=1 Tax=Eiseniibacteriota bacterium TaxID=2212470 RepID=A0A948RSS9_UNCEI|nr:DUF4388 domain-containing protein [Candidatus Eisenbacteria bacterium]MBU1947844.1 DUF4388 domain-containing protein [Candidatus Eisenbacteria bacterium]MBU2690348.1 DUF4388 domain-containing protein [Candidatus Eisenbacteria bacterium]